MNTRQYPYASGSAYTASYAVSASYATNAEFVAFAQTSVSASTVLAPTSGSSAAVDICIITYEQYLTLLNNPTAVEICTFPS